MPVRPVKLVLFAVLAVAVLVMPAVMQGMQNYLAVRIFGVMGIYVMLSLGLNIVVGYAGLLDLGYVAFYGMGAYAGVLAAFFVQRLLGLSYGPWSYWTLLPIAALVAAATGIALGFPVLRLRGDYLAIVTLGFGEIVRIVLVNNPFGLTNGAAGLPKAGQLIPAPAGQAWFTDRLSSGSFAFSSDLWWYYMIVVLCALAIFVIVRLDDSRLGRAWVAMREDMVAAASVGVNLTATKLWAFSLGATWGGVAGITYAFWVGFISPESFNFFESVLVVCMVVLGGMGSIPGAALGAVIIAGLPDILGGLAQSRALAGMLTSAQANEIASYRYLVFGLLMVVMMAVRPQGILASKRRALELKPEDDSIREGQDQELYDVERRHGQPPDNL